MGRLNSEVRADYIRLLSYLRSIADYKTSVVPYLLYIQLKTGLRFGEVFGLTWDCIKWQSKEIYTYRRYDSNNRKWTDPKTPESVRYIPIDDETISILHQIKKEQSGFLLSKPDQLIS